MSALLLAVGIVVMAAVQACLPSLSWLGGLRVEFLPAVVVFVSLTLRRRPAIFCAIAAGLMQDSLSTAPFGITALAFGAVAILITSMRDVLDRELPWVIMGAGALTAAVSSLAACCLAGFSMGALAKLLALTMMSAIVAPILFFAMEYVRLQAKHA